MSEMVLGSDETPADLLNEALVRFTACVGEALEGVCSYSLTVGDSYVPFDPDEDDDCEDGEAACSQAWVRVTSVTPQSIEAYGNDCATTMSIGLEVGVLRCFVIPEGGEAPSSSEVLASAMQAVEDMNALYCAAMNCDDAGFAAITAGSWVPYGPNGGQYGGMWEFTVEWA